MRKKETPTNSKMNEKKTLVKTKFRDKLKILIYIANIIDLTRILFVFIAFLLADYNIFLTYIFYSLSVILDCFDGLAARKLNQLSRIGAMLDMVVDRVSTTLLSVLILKYSPNLSKLIQASIAIDIASHMLYVSKQQVVSAFETNSVAHNHKFVRSTDNPVLKWYYGSKTILGTLCTLNEVFFIALLVYVSQKIGTNAINKFGTNLALVVMIPTLPGHIMKQLVNIIQLLDACNGIIEIDALERKKA